VAAAGNNGKSSVLYPAAYSQVIAVGATDSNKKVSFSNYGSKVELIAKSL
jgi:subtilisin family serine protease